MRKKGMKKAAIVLAATMVFSLFSEAGMAAPQTVQAATYQKTIKNKSVKKPEVLVRADEVKVFSIKVKEVDKQIQEVEIKQPETSADTQISTEENTQQEEETTEDDEVRIVRTKKFGIKPMFPEDDCVQMELLGHNFFVFSNAETDEVNVVYKRKDGSFGLIEPEFS